MKIRILEPSGWYTNYVSYGFEVNDYDNNSKLNGSRFGIHNGGWVLANDCVITDLPDSFCVKRCDDKEKWKKYIKWLNKTYNKEYYDNVGAYYGCDMGRSWSFASPIGTEIHIDDIIKHIDFYSEPMAIESKEEKKMETNLLELIRLFPELPTDYAKELVVEALKVKNGNLIDLSKFINTVKNTLTINYDIIPGNLPDNKADYVWRKINDFKNKEEIMETQRLSRKGLKEIHSVACTSWKNALENWGTRNPLEDYIELTNEEISKMFRDCTLSQSTIVSKYLKQDDGSVDISKVVYGHDGVLLNNKYIVRHNAITSITNGFWLNPDYNWEVKMISDTPFLVPTKKKQSVTSSGASMSYGVVSTATDTISTTTGKYSVGF